jgi:hypothetical protein
VAVSIASKQLRVTINPQVGGTITSITHLGLGLSVLGTVPWNPVDAPIESFAARDETEWLTRYTGGWPILFPNGGDACTFDEVFHGFHGEASISPWTAKASPESLRLVRRFCTVPVEMQRELTVVGDMLIIRERLRMLGAHPIEVMWGHHPTFGSDLLAGPVEITAGTRHVTVDDTYDPAANPLRPGATGIWPIVAGKIGPVDLSRPEGIPIAMAYLHDFDAAWVAMRRTDNAIAVALSWDAAHFPCAWLWYELGGTTDAPWHGRGRVIGIEPNSTRPGMGLANAKRLGSSLLRLNPGEEISTALHLHVFRPSGAIKEMDRSGRATSGS